MISHYRDASRAFVSGNFSGKSGLLEYRELLALHECFCMSPPDLSNKEEETVIYDIFVKVI